MKKWLTLFSFSSLPSLLGVSLSFGLIPVTPAMAADSTELVVYSARKEHLMKPLLDQFSAQTGIQVTLYTGKDGALIERVKSEGSQTPADVLMMADAGNLGYAAEQGLFESINSPLIEQAIPAHLRDPQMRWTALSIRARTIVYSTERVKPEQLSSYAQLGDANWKGRLCLRSGNHVYNKSLVASMIAHEGEAQAKQTVENWVNNLAAKPFAKDSEVMKAILSNRCDVGIVNSYYFGQEITKNPQAKMALFWANQASTGTHINVSGAGIVKASKNKQKALKLLEWLSQDQAQTLYAEKNYEHPANPNNQPSEALSRWGAFKADQLNLAKVAELQQNAVLLMQKAKYQ
ncbi:extracellular solute-binding protein [Thiosulfativibrio zosterae]|nr:extracellular solute-binding protein [Thiosulfativibrio zosterae]